MELFFVYPDLDHSLVLWGMSKVKKVKANTVYFNKFKPLPIEKQLRGLSAKDILGKQWGSGTYRFIDTKIENKLKQLMVTKDESFDDSIETVITDREGRRALKRHLAKERSLKLVAAFKNSLISNECWVCGFNFEKKYGLLGKGFIEAHHIKPISTLKEDELVSSRDFAAVCSNCHRMIHRENPPLNWKKLKALISRNR